MNFVLQFLIMLAIFLAVTAGVCAAVAVLMFVTETCKKIYNRSGREEVKKC